MLLNCMNNNLIIVITVKHTGVTFFFQCFPGFTVFGFWVFMKILTICFSEAPFSTIPEFTYNYIWDDFLRFKIGVDLPLNTVTITAKDEIVEYNQFSLGLKLGLSLVID